MNPGAADQRVEVIAGGRRFEIEVAWVGPEASEWPPIVFLHEGLGSVSMWRDFPSRLCSTLGRRGLVFSRPGYGRSTPRRADEHWGPDFMQFQATEVLPALLAAIGIDGRYTLFGHSDGGSIALIHAALCPDRVGAAIVMAPHILVEDISVASIAAARQAYGQTDLRQRLQRHHADVDSAFLGWADAWLAPGFRHWSIESLLVRIACPVLAIQGLGDEYGTLAQIEGIAARVPDTRLLALPDCGHSPHRDRPREVIDAAQDWLRAISGRRPSGKTGHGSCSP